MLCHTESLFFRYELEKSETQLEYLDSAFEYIKHNYKMKNLDYLGEPDAYLIFNLDDVTEMFMSDTQLMAAQNSIKDYGDMQYLEDLNSNTKIEYF